MHFLLMSPHQKLYVQENRGISKPDKYGMYRAFSRTAMLLQRNNSVASQSEADKVLFNCNLQKLISDADENSIR